MRVGVIGLGSIGRRHLRNLVTLGHEAVGYDISGSAAIEAHQAVPEATCYTSTSVDPLDAWIIATPYHAHLPIAQLAASSGVPFLVEKPLGSTSQRDAWAALAAQTDLSRGDLVTQVGYMLRFHPEASELRALEGPIDLSVGSDMTKWPGTTYGDALHECSHEIDLALWLGAEPVVTDAFVDRGSGYRISLGEHSVRIDADTDTGRRWARGGLVTNAWPADQPAPNAMYLDELEHFLARVAGAALTVEPAASLEDGVKVLDVIRQVEERLHV